MRFSQWQRGSTDQPYVAWFVADNTKNSHDDDSYADTSTAAAVVWMGGDQGSNVKYSLQILSAVKGQPAILIELSPNSTNGIQSAVTVSSAGTISLTVRQRRYPCLHTHAAL